MSEINERPQSLRSDVAKVKQAKRANGLTATYLNNLIPETGALSRLVKIMT